MRIDPGGSATDSDAGSALDRGVRHDPGVRLSPIAPALALICAGCGLLIDRGEPAATGLDAAVRDAAVRDAGARDAGPPDGSAIDAGVSDAGVRDAAPPIADAGACPRDRADCNDEPADGCETDLSSVSSCGECGVACPMGASCVRGAEGLRCECADPLLACEGACVDIRADVDHCGGCRRPCFRDDHGRLACVASECRVIDCGDNYADCNRDPSDGCEQTLASSDHCGSCGVSCPGAAICVAGACAIP